MQMVVWKYLTNHGRCILRVQEGELCTAFLAVLVLSQCTTLHAEEVSAVPQIAFINSQIESVWADAGVEPSEQATDLEWCRRVYLDLIGRIPTVDEVLRYKNDHSSDKRPVLVDHLLGEEYVHIYLRHQIQTRGKHIVYYYPARLLSTKVPDDASICLPTQLDFPECHDIKLPAHYKSPDAGV